MHPVVSTLPFRDGPRFYRSRLRALIAAVAAMLWLTGASPALAGDAGPYISGASLSTSQLEEGGGQVTVTAYAIDDQPISMFYADVQGSNGYVGSYGLYPSYIPDDPGQPWTFTGSVDIPANTLGEPQVYGVSVTATGSNGIQSSANAGDVTVAAAAVFDAFPVLSSPDVAPRSVPARAGTVKISATATDDRSVSSVVAEVQMKEFTFPPTYIELPAASAAKFEGVFNVPDNTTSAARTYEVRIFAVDDIGQSTTIGAGTFSVAPATTLPAGQLALTPAWSVFGPIRRGQKTRAMFAVRNLGKPGSPTLTAYAAVSGKAFSIVGATGAESLVTIEPGKSVSVLVEFAPTKSGSYSGRLSVRRQDGKQRPQVSTLLGLGL